MSGYDEAEKTLISRPDGKPDVGRRKKKVTSEQNVLKQKGGGIVSLLCHRKKATASWQTMCGKRMSQATDKVIFVAGGGGGSNQKNGQVGVVSGSGK